MTKFLLVKTITVKEGMQNLLQVLLSAEKGIDSIGDDLIFIIYQIYENI